VAVLECIKATPDAPVAQWIEHRSSDCFLRGSAKKIEKLPIPLSLWAVPVALSLFASLLRSFAKNYFLSNIYLILEVLVPLLVAWEKIVTRL
jgi:hypothetical protein